MDKPAYRAQCGWCDGKGYVTPLSKLLFGDCKNCNGTGWLTNLTEDDIAWFKEVAPDRLEVVVA